MMEFAASFEREAADVMDDIMAESLLAGSCVSPTLTPMLSLGTADPAEELIDGPTTPQQARANDLFQSFDDGKPSLADMKRCLMHHDESFEL